MDFTTQRILLGAAGGAEPDTYFYAYISSLNENEGLNNIAVDDTNGDVFLSWRSKGIYPYHNYDAHDIAQIDKEGSKVTIVKNTHTPDSSNGGRGVAIKSNGHVAAMSRNGARYGLTNISMGSPSVVSQVFPGPSTSGNGIDPQDIYTLGNDVYLCGRWDYNPYSRGPNVVKLNSSNTLQWSAYLSTSYGYTSKYAQGANGDIAILTNNDASSNNLILAKINSSGSFVTGAYLQNLGHNDWDVAIDSNGDIITLTGATVSTYSQGYAYWSNGILCKFNGSNGNLIWSREIRRNNTSFIGFKVDVGADGTIHVIARENTSQSSVKNIRYVRINSSGNKIYERKISTTFSNLWMNEKLLAKDKNIYIGLSSNYNSKAVFVLKLPDSGDITGSYNQVSITNAGTYYTIGSIGSGYDLGGPTFSSSNWGAINYTPYTAAYQTSNSNVSYPQTNSVTSSGYPLSNYNYSDYTLPL